MMRSNYDLIYAAAEALDVGLLVKHFNAGIRIDTLDRHGLFTPAAALAASCQESAVELLQAFGADISSIAMGYTAGNCTLQAKSIIRNHCVNLKDIAIGAGMSFDPDLRAELTNEFDLAPEWLVFGAVMSEQSDLAEEMLRYLKSEYDDKHDASYASAYQSTLLTYLYAYKMKYGCNTSSSVSDTAYEFSGLSSYVIWIGKLQQDEMHAGDRELQSIINQLYSKEKCGRIPSSKRLIELQNQKNFLDVVAWLPNCDLHYHRPALTYELTFAGYDFINAIKVADSRYSACCDDAVQRKALMQQYHFDYHQATLYATDRLVPEILEQAIANEGEKYQESLRQLADLQNVEGRCEAEDMLHKFYLSHIKLYVIKVLQDFCEGRNNLLTSLFTNPKLTRLASLKIAIAYIESLQDLHELIIFEYGLFQNIISPKPNPLLPYHLQPLANKNTDQDLVRKFADLVHAKYFKNVFSQGNEAGEMIAYKDLSVSKLPDSSNADALMRVREHFVGVMKKFVTDHQSSVRNISLFGNSTHKINRVNDMQEAASRVATRREFIAIALHQFGLYNRLTKPKPHPQAPKYLTLMDDEETSPEFRQMVEGLLTCEPLKPNHFK